MAAAVAGVWSDHVTFKLIATIILAIQAAVPIAAAITR